MRDWTTTSCAIGLTVLVSVAAFAQNSKWAEPYDKALKSIDAKQYGAAIALLEQAVAADPKSSANKYVEGVFRVDYFPYYYLGIAYLEIRNYDKAQENFNKAKNGLPRPLLAKIDDFQKRLTSETALAKGGGATEPPKPQAPAINPNFEPATRQADAALAAKRYADAVTAYDAARNADAVQFARQSLQAKRDEAARGALGQQQAEEARQLLQGSQLRAAKARFQQADQTLPGQKVVADGLATIKQREDSYQSLKSAAEQEAKSNSFRPALEKLAQAKTANPEQYAADNLEARVKLATDKLREASVAVEARNNPAPAPDVRTTAIPEPKIVEKKPVLTPPPTPAFSPATIDAVSPAKPDVDKDRNALRDALRALFAGDASRSIAIIEPALAARPAATSETVASLHAYLGVAYATQALSSPKEDESSRALRAKATEQFRMALVARRDYQLSARVVSPKIVALFEAAR